MEESRSKGSLISVIEGKLRNWWFNGVQLEGERALWAILGQRGRCCWAQGLGPILVRSQHWMYPPAFPGSILSVLFSLTPLWKALLVSWPCLDCVLALAYTCHQPSFQTGWTPGLGVGLSAMKIRISHL